MKKLFLLGAIALLALLVVAAWWPTTDVGKGLIKDASNANSTTWTIIGAEDDTSETFTVGQDASYTYMITGLRHLASDSAAAGAYLVLCLSLDNTYWIRSDSVAITAVTTETASTTPQIKSWTVVPAPYYRFIINGANAGDSAQWELTPFFGNNNFSR